MAFKHSPGCRCCSDTCDIAADAFEGVDMPPLPNWTQVSGTWEKIGAGGVGADGYLSTGDDDALIRHNTAHPDWLAEQWVSVEMRTSAAGDRLRIILAYNPTTLTYLVVEIEFGVNDGMLRFYEFAGYGLTQLGPDVPLMTTLDTWYTVIACYHDGTITAIFTDIDDREIVQYRAATADGYLAGLGTGAITGVPRFNNFNYDRHKTDADKLCPDCKFTCLVWKDRQDGTDRYIPYWTFSGSWTNPDDIWDIGTAGSKSICRVPQSRGLNPANVNITVNPSGGCTTRLYADYLDASNHHCLQVAWTDAGFNKAYQAHVMRVAGGVASAIGSFNGLWTLNGSFPSMHVCIADTAILGVVKSGALTTVHSGLIPTTLHDGMRTGYSVEAGTAAFTDFQFYRHKSTGDDRGCPDCGVTFKCGGACLDSAPAALKLVLTGIGNALCSSCDNINGIYVAPLIYSNSQACVYRAQLPLDCKGPNVADNECKIEVWIDNWWRPQISVGIYLTSVEPDIWFLRSPWTANCATLNNFKMASPSQRTIVCTPAQDAKCLITAL